MAFYYFVLYVHCFYLFIFWLTFMAVTYTFLS
nr:MAG TPA: hypothetical protein [Caudoviricetes sp.]